MGFLDRLFGRSKTTASPKTIDPSLAEQVVNDFGATLGSAAPAAGGVGDASQLPHPKETIKAAILFALSVTTDAAMREQLKSGYLSLADWQDGVGSDVGGLDVSKLDLTDDASELAEQVLSQGMASPEILARVGVERDQLQAELDAAGA